jgi:hypothetical protein
MPSVSGGYARRAWRIKLPNLQELVHNTTPTAWRALMNSRPVTIKLMPLCGGSYTRLQLIAFVPTPLPGRALKKLCALFTLFCGERIQFVLSVDKEAAPWCELWVDSITELPEPQIQARFLLKRKGYCREQRPTS